jgi:hypothetical protein
MMDRELRRWIVDVLEQHRALLTIAVGSERSSKVG